MTDTVDYWAQRAHQLVQEGAQALSTDSTSPDEAYSQIISGIRALRGRGRKDKRSVPWACRVRLYLPGQDEPLADTQPDAAPDAAPDWLITGLPSVGEAVQQVVADYHGQASITGLDRVALQRGIKGLRPTLSRNHGQAVWRIHYGASDVAMIARVDIVRA